MDELIEKIRLSYKQDAGKPEDTVATENTEDTVDVKNTEEKAG